MVGGSSRRLLSGLKESVERSTVGKSFKRLLDIL